LITAILPCQARFCDLAAPFFQLIYDALEFFESLFRSEQKFPGEQCQVDAKFKGCGHGTASAGMKKLL
jgi:hypothetical protein